MPLHELDILRVTRQYPIYLKLEIIVSCSSALEQFLLTCFIDVDSLISAASC